jgi:hypothetical protein
VLIVVWLPSGSRKGSPPSLAVMSSIEKSVVLLTVLLALKCVIAYH